MAEADPLVSRQDVRTMEVRMRWKAYEFLVVTCLLFLPGCSAVPEVDGDGNLMRNRDGSLATERVPFWRVKARMVRALEARGIEFHIRPQAGTGWVEELGKAAGLLLLAAGIVFAVARDLGKGALAAGGGGTLYLSTVFLSEIAGVLGEWIRDWVPWLLTIGLVVAVATVIYAGWISRVRRGIVTKLKELGHDIGDLL